MRPTQPNRTGRATASDTVHTNDNTAQWIVDYFKPSGKILDPSSGDGAFFDKFRNKERFKCEIKEGNDFFHWDKKVDWIITNPPYSIYDDFLKHAFEIADNVVFFVPIAKAFKSNKIQRLVKMYGGLKELIYMGGGSKHGFAFGFPVGCLHYKRNHHGNCIITDIIT